MLWTVRSSPDNDITSPFVIPAQAGIHVFQSFKWTPAFARVTDSSKITYFGIGIYVITIKDSFDLIQFGGFRGCVIIQHVREFLGAFKTLL
jgi:hypothetical protein